MILIGVWLFGGAICCKNGKSVGCLLVRGVLLFGGMFLVLLGVGVCVVGGVMRLVLVVVVVVFIVSCVVLRIG